MNYFLADVLQKISKQLEKIYSVQTAHYNSWLLLEKLLNKTRIELIAQKTINLSPEEGERLNKWIEEITVHHKPLQYIIGSVPFLQTTIFVKPPLLIPRPETEEWTDFLIKTIKKSGKIPSTLLDMCTGTGCIAIALVHSLPVMTVYASDNNPSALELTQHNAKSNNVQLVLMQSDLYTHFPPELKFDLIVSNPPYIDPALWKSLDPEVREWEDKNALCADNKGLALIEKIVTQAPQFLSGTRTEYPTLWVEIGYDQGETVRDIFEKTGFYKVEILKDSNGKDRVVTGFYG